MWVLSWLNYSARPRPLFGLNYSVRPRPLFGLNYSARSRPLSGLNYSVRPRPLSGLNYSARPRPLSLDSTILPDQDHSLDSTILPDPDHSLDSTILPDTTQEGGGKQARCGPLSREDKSILCSPSAWVPDTIIDAAQKLLNQKVPLQNGFQDNCCGRTCAFDIESTEFVKILHNGHDHWLTISTFGTDKAEVFVYDSHYPSVSILLCEKADCCSTSNKAQHHIEAHGRPDAIWNFKIVGSSQLHLPPLLYTMNVLAKFLNGVISQESMRQDLMKCLELGKMTMFPVKWTRWNAGRTKSKDIIETVLNL